MDSIRYISKEPAPIPYLDQPLKYSLDKVQEYYEQHLDPSRNYSQYKQENEDLLNRRARYNYSNFQNIGGNPHTRVAFPAPGTNNDVFVEGSWVATDKIASGFPSAGTMVNSYWYSIESLLKTHSVFIVNLMADKDMKGKFKPFLPELELPLELGSGGLSLLEEHQPWKRTLICKEKKQYTSWFRQVIQCEGHEVPAYVFSLWKDHGSAEIEVVSEMVKMLHEEMKGQSNPVVWCNCRAGVGRTGTFLVALHYYQMIQKGELSPELFTLEAIGEVIGRFREKRGEAQFVQTESQFIMLCQLIQLFYNEKRS